ncbi:MAG: type II toxin-antitoxin system VapC family toxin [Sphingobacteriales bacterium]
MRIILDTHALIWFTEGDNKLSSKAISAISNTTYKKYVSIASLWEIVIKSSKSKLELKQSFAELNHFLSLNQIEVIAIESKHLNTLLTLPHHHGDPFDRLIIAQAITENLTIVSADRHFEGYAVEIFW